MTVKYAHLSYTCVYVNVYTYMFSYLVDSRIELSVRCTTDTEREGVVDISGEQCSAESVGRALSEADQTARVNRPTPAMPTPSSSLPPLNLSLSLSSWFYAYMTSSSSSGITDNVRQARASEVTQHEHISSLSISPLFRP